MSLSVKTVLAKTEPNITYLHKYINEYDDKYDCRRHVKIICECNTSFTPEIAEIQSICPSLACCVAICFLSNLGQPLPMTS